MNLVVLTLSLFVIGVAVFLFVKNETRNHQNRKRMREAVDYTRQDR